MGGINDFDSLTGISGGTDGTTIGNNGNKLLVDGSGVTQPISAVSLPLPSGAATSALQTTGNTSVASIDTKTPTLGQKTMSGSAPVVLPSDQVISVGTVVSQDQPNTQIINGNGFCALTNDGQLSVGTSELPIIYFKNNGSKTIYIYNIFLSAKASIASNWLQFKTYQTPTITAVGTAMTDVNLLIGSANTSSAQVYRLPSASSNGTLMNIWFDGTANSAGYIKARAFNGYVVLAPTKTILITAIAKGNSTDMYAVLNWFEV